MKTRELMPVMRGIRFRSENRQYVVAADGGYLFIVTGRLARFPLSDKNFQGREAIQEEKSTAMPDAGTGNFPL